MHRAVAISSHGYGHGAQTTAVLTALRARLPELRLTLLTGLPRAFLEQRIPGEFTLIDWRGDFGMHMRSALDVDVERNVLTVKAERRPTVHAEDVEMQIAERPLGVFQRQLFLGDNLDTDNIHAEYEAGVLSLRIPVAEQAKPRKIEVKVGAAGSDRKEIKA